MAGYDSGRDELDEEDEEDVATGTAEEEEETDEMPPLGYQEKLILERVGNMFHDHNQAINERLVKKDEWYMKMYETLATTTSRLAQRQDMLRESVASLEGLMRELLTHPAMQEAQDVVTPPEVREMLPWDELPVIPPPHPPPQGNSGHE